MHKYNKNWLPFNDNTGLYNDELFNHYNNIDRVYIYNSIFYRNRIRFVRYNNYSSLIIVFTSKCLNDKNILIKLFLKFISIFIKYNFML